MPLYGRNSYPTFGILCYLDLVEGYHKLDPVKGALTRTQLLHLLRRCLFGVGVKELAFFDGKNIDQCMDILLTPAPMPPPPLQEDSDVSDNMVAKGSTWINSPYESDLIDSRRQLFLKMWWVGRLLNRDYSITEKMTLFCHNHFVVEMDMIKDSRYCYRYAALLREHSLGNYKKMISDGCSNLAMLVYLGGNLNIKGAPNENFARELLELFTLGKGPDVKYTENDVREAARIFSGYKDNKETISVDFHPELHDSGDKQFSAYFGDHIIKGRAGNDGIKEIDELIDMIFRKMEVAQFICRNIYRWLVCDIITGETEKAIILPMAEVMIAHDFEMTPVLRMLLSSEHFFDPSFRGCIVKSPVDFLIGAMQQMDVVSFAKVDTDHESWLQFYFSMGDLSMDIGNPPSVSGWPAYYQAPKYHEWWANSASLGLRSKIMKAFCSDHGMEFNGRNINFDVLSFAGGFAHPGNVNMLTDHFFELMLAVDTDEDRRASVKNKLLAGWDETAWSRAWSILSDHPEDAKTKNDLKQRLSSLLTMALTMPEYQMM